MSFLLGQNYYLSSLIETPPDIFTTEKNIIYCIRNKITNQRYIGKTIRTFNKRYAGGSWWKYTTNPLLKKDYETYGQKAFEVSILDSWGDQRELLIIESHYISWYNTLYPNGYNLVYDDDPLGFLGEEGELYRFNLQENKLYVRKKDKASWLHFAFTGQKMTDEAKQKISKANSGKKLTLEHRKKLSERKLGRKLSAESLRKRILKQYKPVLRLDAAGNCLEEYPSNQAAAKALNISTYAVGEICKRGQKTRGPAKGLILKYK